MISFLVSVFIDNFYVEKREVNPPLIKLLFIYFPTVIISLWLIAGRSMSDFIVLLLNNTKEYILVSLLLAISTFGGGLLDSAFALCGFCNKTTRKKLSKKSIYYIAKYGSEDCLIKGKGRYDLSLNNIAYDIISNLTGAICPIMMLAYIKTIPKYENFLQQTVWIDYISVFGPFMVIPSLSGVLNLQKKGYPNSIYNKGVNPDNYLMSRLHVAMGAVSLWFTNTMVLVLGFTYIVFSIMYPNSNSISWRIILPILALTMYITYQVFSGVTVLYNSVNVVGYRIGEAVIVAVVMITLIFNWSIIAANTVILLLLFTIALILYWEWIVSRIKKITQNTADWNKITKWIPLMIGAVILILVLLVWIQTAS